VTPAFAVDAGQAEYAGGTWHVPKGTVGTLDTTAPAGLVFRYGGASAAEVAIDYRNISNFEYTSPVAHHLGLLPFIVRGLIRPQERRHFFRFGIRTLLMWSRWLCLRFRRVIHGCCWRCCADGLRRCVGRRRFGVGLARSLTSAETKLRFVCGTELHGRGDIFRVCGHRLDGYGMR
jgi:hypothetical protein